MEKRRVTLESRCQHESAARACLFLNSIQAPLRTRLRTFAKTGLEISGHDKVVDRILCVWFCGPKKTFVFGSQKRSIREGLMCCFCCCCCVADAAPILPEIPLPFLHDSPPCQHSSTGEMLFGMPGMWSAYFRCGRVERAAQNPTLHFLILLAAGNRKRIIRVYEV